MKSTLLGGQRDLTFLGSRPLNSSGSCNTHRIGAAGLGAASPAAGLGLISSWTGDGQRSHALMGGHTTQLGAQSLEATAPHTATAPVPSCVRRGTKQGTCHRAVGRRPRSQVGRPCLQPRTMDLVGKEERSWAWEPHLLTWSHQRLSAQCPVPESLRKCSFFHHGHCIWLSPFPMCLSQTLTPLFFLDTPPRSCNWGA